MVEEERKEEIKEVSKQERKQTNVGRKNKIMLLNIVE
jgi:hypothetical protein